MIQQKIKVLLVEDNSSDAKLIERQVKKIVAFPEILHIKKFKELTDALEEFRPDVILSDYNLIEFTGFDVLQYVTTLHRHIPLIFVTGTINDEEIAASTILNGATGYLLKKNINTLHEKLSPYFEKIVQDHIEEPITSEHKQVFDEMRSYLEAVKADNKMIKASYHEMKKALEKMKSLNK